MNRSTAILNGKKHSWLLPLVLASGLFWLWPFSPGTTPPKQVSYSTFLAEVRTGHVLEVAIDERFLVMDLVGDLEVLDGESLGCFAELFLQLGECHGGPVFGTFEQDAYAIDLVGVIAHERGKRGQVVGGFVFFAVGPTDSPLG